MSAHVHDSQAEEDWVRAGMASHATRDAVALVGALQRAAIIGRAVLKERNSWPENTMGYDQGEDACESIADDIMEGGKP